MRLSHFQNGRIYNDMKTKDLRCFEIFAINYSDETHHKYVEASVNYFLHFSNKLRGTEHYVTQVDETHITSLHKNCYKNHVKSGAQLFSTIDGTDITTVHINKPIVFPIKVHATFKERFIVEQIKSTNKKPQINY